MWETLLLWVSAYQPSTLERIAFVLFGELCIVVAWRSIDWSKWIDVSGDWRPRW